MQYKLILAFLAVSAISIFTSCSKIENIPSKAVTSSQTLQEKISENGTNPDEAVLSKENANNAETHFYIESNKKSKNTILVFTQKTNGQLVLEDEVASGGYGYGTILGSQGALAVSKEYNLLFAVNAGSGTVSSFRINPNTGGLKLLFTAYSNGQLPNSITVYGNKLYVLNNLSASIAGFTFTSDGFITPVKGSVHNLSEPNADGPQIKFQPDGKAVYVTEKATNLIDKFDLDDNGAVTNVTYIHSKGVEPFGFDYARNERYIIVSNTANDFSGAGSATSYKFSNAKGLVAVSGPISDFETAPCWVATTEHGVFAFVANTVTNNISSYYIDENGMLTLIKAVAAADGKKPLDIAVSADNRYVYELYSDSHAVVAYTRKTAGVIEFSDKVTTLPAPATGLAVY